MSEIHKSEGVIQSTEKPVVALQPQGTQSQTPRIDFEAQALLDTELQLAKTDKRCLVSTVKLSPIINSSLGRSLLFSPFPRLYIERKQWETLNHAERYCHVTRALAFKHPSWIFCDISAALLHGLSVSRKLLKEAHIAVTGTHGSKQGRIYRHNLPAIKTEIIDGIKVTTLEQTVFDCACRLPFDEALIIADSAQRINPSIQEKLVELIASFPHRKGISKAKKITKYINGLSESGAESLARAHMIEMGYVIPELQVVFPDPLHKGKTFRVDMLVKKSREKDVAIEVDGEIKYSEITSLNTDSTIKTFMKERQREALLTIYDLDIMRLHYDDIVNEKRLFEMLELYKIPRRPYARNKLISQP